MAGRRTVLIYGHYDVQPVDPLDLWTSPPFEPEIRDGKIWARGATDNKGQLLAHVLGVEQTLRENGELPVNLIFLFEGEEEIGSLHLAEFLTRTARRLAVRRDRGVRHRDGGAGSADVGVWAAGHRVLRSRGARGRA